MKILLGISSQNDEVLGISTTLREMGHEVIIIRTDEYRTQCSYFLKKCDKLGFHMYRRQYEYKWLKALSSLVDDSKVQVGIFINPPNEVIEVQQFKKIYNRCNEKRIRLVCWTVDPVKDNNDVIECCRYFDNVYVYEKSDVKILGNHGVIAEYLPVGYNQVYENVETNKIKCWDICFVGTPYKNRLKTLNIVAQKAIAYNWKFKVVGPFWEKWHIWKPMLLKYKYPYLYNFIENKRICNKDVAALYKSSKICLNIHTGRAASLNPRAFEIMATGSFEMVDIRNDYDNIVPQRDLVEYKDDYDLLRKLTIYINDDVEREKIALGGKEKVSNSYSLKASLDRIINSVRI